MSSIRLRLLVTLLPIFVVFWLFTTLATYLESRHEIEELFDAALAQSAAVLSEITPDSGHSRSAAELQAHSLRRELYGHRYEKKIAFQIWQDRQLLLRSASAPAEPMSAVLGYSDTYIDAARWRIFALRVGEHQRIVVGERYDVRDELVFNIVRDSLYPLVVVLPLLAASIWFGVRRNLEPLQRITDEVTRRSPRQLQHMADSRVPAEIRPLVDALNDLLTRLREAFARERQFTADAAHELRTPLASLKTQAQVAQRASDEAERNRALGNIVQGVDRATHLVEQLLTLARLDPQTITGQLQPLAMSPLVADTLAQLAEFAERKHIDLSLREGKPCKIMGNAVALGTMLRNLVDNAIRYTPEHGQVSVCLEGTDHTLTVRITDNGPGIPETHRQRIFDRFYRGEPGNSHGCGLGLAIAQNIAKLHGSTLHLSTPSSGKGLQVSVTLRCVD